ncbi:MAG: T9SS type A sorting domain-containing protein [Flavobacteriales bacterium]
MKKIVLNLIALTTLGFGAIAQPTVNIPDPAFKTFLVTNTAINTNMDSEIQTNEAHAFTDYFDCSDLGITDLTGIEAFDAITTLNCSDNSLGTIDLSNNTALTYLNCSSAGLNALDITQNTALTNLQCVGNNLSVLDLTQNPGLTHLSCNANNIGALDLSQNIGLLSFSCGGNNITSLDFSQNPLVVEINCIQNDLVTLDVTACTNLNTLTCQNNFITALDVSNNTSLYGFNCQNNDLTVLNMKNLSTTSNLTSYFYATSNNLTCIDVDNVAAAEATWTNISSGVSFSTNCVTDYVSSINVQGEAGASTITVLGGTLQMEASVVPTYADNDTYTWSVTNGTGSATIDANGLLTAATNGTVTVVATANDGSGVFGNTVVTISNQNVGINEAAEKIQVAVYPNPVASQFTVTVDEKIESITIVDVAGKTVKSLAFTTNTIDVSDLTKGMYFLQIQTANGLASKQLIKE